MARLASNYRSSSDDVMSRGGSQSRERSVSGPTPVVESRTVTLSEALRAGAQGEVDPLEVYCQMPPELMKAVDAAAQGIGKSGFSALSKSDQQSIFAALLQASNGQSSQVTSPVMLGTSNSPQPAAQKRPWWKLWS